MISFIRGILDGTDENGAVVDVSGFGMYAMMPVSALEALPAPGEEVKIYTYLAVSEDSVRLFGFLSKDDLRMFELLIGVNGVGPKAALSILSALGSDDLRYAVLSDDAKAIAKAPGIGSKTALKVILELKDKLSLGDLLPERSGTSSAVHSVSADNSAKKDAILALTSLGYSSSEAMKAVKAVDPTPDMDSAQIIKAALKKIGM